VEHEPCLGLTRCELVWVRHGTIEKVFNKLVELFTAKELRAKYFCEKKTRTWNISGLEVSPWDLEKMK
jgi:hypothetical protein